jgi:hypothetical protein
VGLIEESELDQEVAIWEIGARAITSARSTHKLLEVKELIELLERASKIP